MAPRAYKSSRADPSKRFESIGSTYEDEKSKNRSSNDRFAQCRFVDENCARVVFMTICRGIEADSVHGKMPSRIVIELCIVYNKKMAVIPMIVRSRIRDSEGLKNSVEFVVDFVSNSIYMITSHVVKVSNGIGFS